MFYTPNTNMVDHSVGAWDELHESEASQASVTPLFSLLYLVDANSDNKFSAYSS